MLRSCSYPSTACTSTPPSSSPSSSSSSSSLQQKYPFRIFRISSGRLSRQCCTRPRPRTTRCSASVGGVPFLGAYETLLRDAPLATKCVTSGILFALADVIAQTVEASSSQAERGREGEGEREREGEREDDIDVTRVARYSFFGFAIQAPLFDTYYTLQDRVVDGVIGLEGTSGSPILKLAVDQLFWTPFLYLPVFFGGMALLELKGREEAMQQVRQKGWGLTTTLVANWRFWVPVNLANYVVVPPDFRILWTNCASLVWTAYLSKTRQENE